MSRLLGNPEERTTNLIIGQLVTCFLTGDSLATNLSLQTRSHRLQRMSGENRRLPALSGPILEYAELRG